MLGLPTSSTTPTPRPPAAVDTANEGPEAPFDTIYAHSPPGETRLDLAGAPSGSPGRPRSAPAPSPARKRRAPAPATDASPPKKLPNTDFIKDRLGTLVADLSATLLASSSWDQFVAAVHGKSYLADTIDGIDHPAKQLLQFYRDIGVPVVLDSPEW